MENLPDKYESFCKINEILRTCTSLEHISTTNKMIKQFFKVYEDSYLTDSLLKYTFEKLLEIVKGHATVVADTSGD